MSEWGKRWLLATCTVCLGSSGMALAQPHQEMPRLGIFWMEARAGHWHLHNRTFISMFAKIRAILRGAPENSAPQQE